MKFYEQFKKIYTPKTSENCLTSDIYTKLICTLFNVKVGHVGNKIMIRRKISKN